VIDALRECFGKALDSAAIAIPVQARRFGISVAMFRIRRCTRPPCSFLAARADVPAEEMRRRFPAQLKIGPVEAIGNLVNLQLPGVRPCSAGGATADSVPRGFVYFELESKPRALGPPQELRWHPHAYSGEFPGLSLNSGQFAPS